MKIYIKGTVVFGFIGIFIAKASVLHFLIRNPKRRRDALMTQVSKYSRRILKVLGVQTQVENLEVLKSRSSSFVVSNHVSYLDVLILASIRPMVFVTSTEVRDSMFLGLITKLGGSLFTDRRTKNSVGQDIRTISDVLRADQSVMLFPEATSTNGESILPLKPAMFLSAIRAKRNILPVVIQYTKLNGAALTPESRDQIFYYGDMNFFPHLLNLLRLQSIQVRLKILNPISVTESSVPRDLADSTHRHLLKAYDEEERRTPLRRLGF